MTGDTLASLVDMFRMEIGASSQPGQGVGVLPAHQNLMRRTQEWLYDDYDWPHLQFDCDHQIIANERYYSFPTTINPFRLIGKPSVYYNSYWYRVDEGISPAVYNISDPLKNQSQDPVCRWRRYNDGTQGQQQFEVWPMPTLTSTLRFRAMLALPPLLAATDTAVIDGRLITLIAAAEYLTSRGDKGAGVKQSAAQRLYASLKGNMDAAETYQLGGPAPSMQETPQCRDGRWWPLMAKGA